MGQVNLGGTGPGSYTKYDRTFRPRINVDTRGGGLYGYEPGYTNLGMFLPYTIEDDTAILFGDVRAIVTHDGKGGANVGAGWRWWMEDVDRIVGLSAWYDFDAGHAQSYDQIGLSFESLGRFVDFRTNGYMPIGKRDHTLGTVLDSTNTNFIGNGLFFNRTTRAEQTFTGFDTEVGGPVPLLGRYGVNGYLGGYHFIGNGQLGGSVTGLSTRLMAQVNEDVSVGVQLTDDNVFGTNVQAQVFVTLPEGTPSRWLRNPRVQDRLTSSVFRQFRVLAKVDTFDVPEAAINPKDGQPYFVTHIDPNGAATGAGTIANPLNSIAAYNNLSLAQRQQSDIIYVRPRADDTNTNLDTGATPGTLTLFNGQRLLTTSVQNQFASNVITGGFGFLPGFVAGAELPNIFNSTGGDVVTLAANATQCIEVSGFDITGSATGNGIQGSNNTWVAINNNNIHDALNGVVLTDLHGTVAAGTAAQILDNNFHDNINDGFHVTNTGAPPLDVIVQGNSFVNNGDDGLQLDANGGSVINGIIGGAEITPADPGPPVVAAVTLGNTFRNNGAHGLHLTANAGTLNFLSPPGPDGSGIINNDFTANGLDGLHIETTNGSTGNFDVIGNRFGLVNLGGVPIDNLAGALTGNQRYGLSLFSDSGTTTINIGGETAADGTVLGNEFGFNRVSAIDIAVTGTSILNYDINNNTVRNSSSATIAAPRDAVTFTFNGISGTDPFFVTNNSDTGVNISSVTWNLAGTPARFDSNNVAIGTGNSALEPQNGSDLLTGLDTVNGFGVIPGGIPPLTAIGTGNPIGTAQIPDGSQSLTLGYLDFDPTEVFSATTIVSNNGGGATPLSSLATAGSTVTVLFSNNLSTTFALSQVDTGGIAVAGSGLAFGRASPGFGAGGDGIHVSASGNSSLNQSMIHNNTVNGYGGFGIHVETSGSAQAPNIVIENNITSFNGTGVNSSGAPVFTGGGLAIERNGDSLFHALVQNNQITSNFYDGFTILGAGTVTGDMTVNSLDNSVLNNAGDGAELLASEQVALRFNSTRDQFVGNNNSGFHALTTDTSAVQLDFRNVLATDNVESGFNTLAQGDSSLQVVITSPVDPLFTAGTGSSFSNNGLDGFGFGSVENGFATASLTDTLFNDNIRDGLSFNREGASLTLVEMADSQVTRNRDDGIQFYTFGSAPSDPNQPLPFQPNQLDLNNVIVDNNGVIGAANGGNGLEVVTQGASTLVVNATQTSFSFNATDGVRVFSGGNSSFGEAGTRSTFDGVTINENGRDGIKLFVMGSFSSKPFQFVEVSSVSGVTTISNNGDDGIQASAPFGTIDLNVIGSPFVSNTMFIQQNAGNGIEFNVADVAIDGDDAEDLGQRTDGDGDGAANEILNFFFANGFEFQSFDNFNGIGVLNVQDAIVGDNNPNDSVDLGNGQDGIQMFVSNIENFSGISNTPQDVNRDTVADLRGAGGSGNIQILSGTAGRLDVTITDTLVIGNGRDGLNYIGDGGNSTFDVGNLITSTVTGSTISSNTRHGVNIDLEGKFGEYDVRFGVPGSYSVASANRFTFDSNVIERNLGYGLRYQANAGVMARANFGPAGGTNHWSVEFGDLQPTDPAGNFNAAVVAQTAIGPIFNSDSPVFALDSLYYSIATDLNSRLELYANQIRSNGNPGIPAPLFNEGGDGVFIRVSTNSYLSADIGSTLGSGLGNTFSGNQQADLRFVSFTATLIDGVTPTFPNASTAVNPGLDRLFLDDTAQLALRMNNNTGTEVSSKVIYVGGNVGERAAAYSQNGTAFIGGSFIRGTQMFQVDDVLNVNANNSFTTPLINEFLNNGGWEGTILDPAWGDPLFPRDYIESPNNPFTP